MYVHISSKYTHHTLHQLVLESLWSKLQPLLSMIISLVSGTLFACSSCPFQHILGEYSIFFSILPKFRTSIWGSDGVQVCFKMIDQPTVNLGGLTTQVTPFGCARMHCLAKASTSDVSVLDPAMLRVATLSSLATWPSTHRELLITIQITSRDPMTLATKHSLS